jgi:hypothetical protein
MSSSSKSPCGPDVIIEPLTSFDGFFYSGWPQETVLFGPSASTLTKGKTRGALYNSIDFSRAMIDWWACGN